VPWNWSTRNSNSAGVPGFSVMAEIAASLSQSRLKRSGFDSKPIWSVGTQLSPELSEDAAWESRISFQHRLKWTWSPVLNDSCSFVLELRCFRIAEYTDAKLLALSGTFIRRSERESLFPAQSPLLEKSNFGAIHWNVIHKANRMSSVVLAR
jgi:hypothetical protein